MITSIGVTLAGAMVLTAPPAQAKLSETDFGFQSTAFGTRVKGPTLGLSSGRTAYSYIGCTRLAGIDRDIDADDLAKVNIEDMVQVAAIDSRNRTYRQPRKGISGVLGVNTIGEVTLGPASDGPRLVITGLRTTARAWHKKGAGFRTATTLDSDPIKLTGVVPAEAPEELRGPLEDLLGGVNEGVQGVLDALRDNAGAIEIPGLGTVSLGWEKHVKRRTFAYASAYALRIQLAGQDTVVGTPDDIDVQLGRAWARINANLPAGVFQGLGYGLQADVAERKIQTGRVNAQPLPCAGTNRQVRSSAPADLNLGEADALELSVLSGRSFGVQHKDGRARAWTEGRVARVRLGGAAGVEIRGVLGRANIRQTKAGRVFASSRGTTPGCIYFDGRCQGLPEDGQEIEIPGGVALLEVNKVSKGKRGIRVTALQITLFADTPLESVVRLGNAHVRIRRV